MFRVQGSLGMTHGHIRNRHAMPIHAVHHVVRRKEKCKTRQQAGLIQVRAIQIQISQVDDGNRC